MAKLQRILVLIGLVLALGGTVAAEKLTTVAVVEIDKVHLTFYGDSKSIREFEQARLAIQEELTGHANYLNKLKEQRLAAVAAGNDGEVLRLDQEINQKTQFITEFKKVKLQQLDVMKRNLGSAEALMRDIDDAVNYIAISEGYTLVLYNTAATPLKGWWSPEIDITSKVIARLKELGR